MRKTTIALCLFLFAGLATAMDFEILESCPANKVHFFSEATLESFDGETTAIKGTISVPEHAVDSSCQAYFEVDLRELRTGISKRDAHMRNNHLHTDKFPLTSFKLKEALKTAILVDGQSVEVTLLGDFDLHGVTKERELKVSITWYSDGAETPAATAGPVLHVSTKYDVPLADHEIPRPAFLFMKMAEEVNMSIDFWAAAS